MSGFLRFCTDEEQTDVVTEVFWEASWPPPETMYLVTGPETGRIVVVGQEGVDQVRANDPEGFDAVITQRCRRVRASSLTDEDLAGMDHPVIRLALYLPEGGVVDG